MSQSSGSETLRPFGPPTRVVVGTLTYCPLDGVDHKTDLSVHHKVADLLQCIKLTAQLVRDERGRFWFGGRQRRGIARVVQALLPFDMDNVDTKTHQPFSGATGRVERYQDQGTPSHYKSGCYAALVATVRALKSTSGPTTLLSELSGGLIDSRKFARVHGQLVDYQFECFVNLSWREFCKVCPVIDPCVATGLEVIKRRGWVLVAAQVGVYNEHTDIASAIDLIATDVQADPVAYNKRVRIGVEPKPANLYLIEIKTRCSCDPIDAYKNGHGKIKTGVFSGERMSQYTRDQTQVFLLRETVETVCDVPTSNSVDRRQPRPTRNVKFKEATVLRLQPGLGSWFDMSGSSISSRHNEIMLAIKHLQRSLTIPPSLDLQRECTGCEQTLAQRPRFYCSSCSGVYCILCEAYCRCIMCNAPLCESCAFMYCKDCQWD